MELGARIAYWRKVKKLTQAELAKKLGLTPAAVYHWEADDDTHVDPSLANLTALVAVLDLTMERFYGARIARAQKAD